MVLETERTFPQGVFDHVELDSNKTKTTPNVSVKESIWKNFNYSAVKDKLPFDSKSFEAVDLVWPTTSYAGVSQNASFSN